MRTESSELSSTIAGRLADKGWAVVTFDDPDRIASDLLMYATLDPRDTRKKHARDVVDWTKAGETFDLIPAQSISFRTETGHMIDDFSRMPLGALGGDLVRDFLGLLPDLPDRGAVSGDLFRYATHQGLGAHRDKFGRWIAILCLEQAEEGGGNALIHDNGQVEFRAVLRPGDMLVFDDDRFQHLVDPLRGSRTVLILITLKGR